MTQKKRILIAGTMTGLILMTLLGLGFTNVAALFRQNSAQVAPTEQVVQPVKSDDGSVQALQNYAAELEATLRIMQAREAQYRQQLETANETITQMQQPVQPNFGSFVDDDHLEHEGSEGFEHDD